MAEFRGTHQDNLKERFLRPGEKLSRRELLKLAVPFGKVEIDDSRCTGCELCTLECPTGALAVSQGEDDSYQLTFRHGFCLACGKCIEICPEECLHLERTLELDRIHQPAKVLFKDRIVRCRECNNFVATERMIRKLQDKVPAVGGSFWFELCPSCKIKTQFSL